MNKYTTRAPRPIYLPAAAPKKAKKPSTQLTPLAVTHPQRFAQLLVALRGNLHKAAPGKVCKCGACRHHLAAASLIARVQPIVLIEHLSVPVEQKATPVAPRQPLTGQVGANATVIVNGRRTGVAEGVRTLAERMS